MRKGKGTEVMAKKKKVLMIIVEIDFFFLENLFKRRPNEKRRVTIIHRK